MATEWEDITDLCRKMAEELKQTEKVCPMMSTPSFSLYDSMSAVEVSSIFHFISLFFIYFCLDYGSQDGSVLWSWECCGHLRGLVQSGDATQFELPGPCLPLSKNDNVRSCPFLRVFRDGDHTFLPFNVAAVLALLHSRRFTHFSHHLCLLDMHGSYTWSNAPNSCDSGCL